MWGDGLAFISYEEWDDGNNYSGDGCSNNWTLEPDWEWSDHDLNLFTPQECIRSWGNAKRNSTEECDDGNSFDFDGCSSECKIDTGYSWSGGSLTTPDTWIENQFMPKSELTVTTENNLKLTFNDTMLIQDIAETDLYIQIYGPEGPYVFTWTAKYTDNKTVTIDMTYETPIQGSNRELVVVEYLERDKFKSSNSLREVTPENELSGYLNSSSKSSNAGLLGQSAMYIFIASILLALISSFGGNSMEMIWGLMNTLQILFFLSFVYVEFPKDLDSIFKYLSWANADNEYVAELSFLLIPENKFSEVEPKGKFEDVAFYVSSADKIPILISIILVFTFTLTLDCLNITQRNKCMRIVYKIVEYFKYNFFFRFGIEIFLELILNSLVNIHFVSILNLISI